MTMNVNAKQSVPTTKTTSSVEVLGPGKSGAAVKTLQLGLSKLGYTLAADGIYGPQTTSAVKDFQKDQGLTVDGIAGPKTQSALQKALAAKEAEAVKAAEQTPAKTETAKPSTTTAPTSTTSTTPTTSTTTTTPTTTIPTDNVEISDPNYPTVGDYVKQEFKDTMDKVVTGMHFTAELLPPVLLGEIATIKAKHELNATKRIWDLPMDPEGKWKDKARAIMDEEATLASKEIAELPMVKAMNVAAVTIKEGVVWTGQQIKNGVVWAGNTIKDGAVAVGNAVVDGAVATGVVVGKGVEAVGKGIEWTGQKIQEGSIAAGEAVKDGARAIKDGVVWTGQKIADGAEAVGEATMNGIRAVGHGARWIGHEYVEANKSVARGFLNGIKAIGDFLSGSAEKTLPKVQPTPFED